MINIQNHRYGWMAMLLMTVMLLVACSSGDNDASDAPTDYSKLGEPVSITIHVPTEKTTSNARTRVGDPGSSTHEGQDWDKLTIIIAYKSKATSEDGQDAEPTKMVYWDTFLREEFEKNEQVTHPMTILDAPLNDNGTRSMTMFLPAGTVNAYGVTYSDGAGLDLENILSQIAKDGKSHSSEIEALQITNDYALGSDKSINISKFLSVATGYGVDTRINNSPTTNTPSARDLVISKDKSELEMKQYWGLYLSRLATKLDIQWDAKGAYEKKDADGNLVYTDVEVSEFTYNGGATNLGENERSGYGRLFPTLQSGTVSALGGTKTFINTSEISKRNGRQYHYFFPDGSKTPSMTFKLTTKKDGESTTEEQKYTFQFGDKYLPLQPGAWYKINATIKGQSTTSTTITVGSDSQ